MGRNARKKKRHTSPRSQSDTGSAKSPSRGWLAPVGGIVAIALGLIWYGGGFESSRSPGGSELPEPPPVDVAELLGVSESPADDVEGLRDEASRMCEALVRDLPDRPEAYSVLALTEYHHGSKDEALAAWQQARQLDAAFSPAQLGIGMVAADKENNREAITAFRRTIELNPSTEEAYAKLVEVLLRENEAEEALKVGQEFARRFPENRKATYWLGQTYLQLERYEDAVAAHKSVIRKHPDLTPSYYSLAMALARLGHREEAAETRREFAELKEKDLQKGRDQNRSYVDLEKQTAMLVNTHLSAGNVYLCVGNPAKAEAHWLRGIQVCPEDVDCRRALAALHESQKRWRSLEAIASELVELKSDDPAVWQQLARAGGHLERFDDAEAAYRQAISIAPDATPAYRGLLRLGLQANRVLPDGVSLAQKAVELAPSPDSYVLLSTVLEQSGDRDRALAAMEAAIRLAPDHPQLKQVYQELQNR